MKNKPFEMCLLFDFYGDILTDKQRELFDLYYNEDLSLAEISEHVGITRQGVRDGIVRAEHTLTEMENKLRLVARYGRIPSQLEDLERDLHQIQLTNNTKYRSPDLAVLLDRMGHVLQEMQGGHEAPTDGDDYGI